MPILPPTSTGKRTRFHFSTAATPMRRNMPIICHAKLTDTKNDCGIIWMHRCKSRFCWKLALRCDGCICLSELCATLLQPCCDRKMDADPIIPPLRSSCWHHHCKNFCLFYQMVWREGWMPQRWTSSPQIVFIYAAKFVRAWYQRNKSKLLQLAVRVSLMACSNK